MSFVSPEFALAALLFFAVFWSLKAHRALQLGFLVLSSYLLYLSWSPKAALALFSLSVFVWVIGNRINQMERGSALKVLMMAVGVLASLALLLVTKYYEFVRQTITDVLPALGMHSLMPALDIVAPAGVSFFTFQAITCLVWCYRSERQSMPLLKILAFLAFWPTLFSGPILRAGEFFRQIDTDDFGAPQEVPRAIYLILLGLLQKLVLENWLSETFVESAFRYPETLDALEAASAIWAYTLEIFLDFAGYSLIVTGLALLMGYRIPPNFMQPYLARNLRDFWRGWHISLSSFIRDYIYIPLGGSKKGIVRTQINIMIAMLVSGIWHGASLTFVVWGGLHGLGVLVVHLADKLGLRMPRMAAHVMTLVYVALAWVFFKAASFDDAWQMLQQLTVMPHGFQLQHVLLFWVTLGFLVLSQCAARIEEWATALISELWGWRLVTLTSMLSFLIIRFGPSGIPGFIYYRF